VLGTGPIRRLIKALLGRGVFLRPDCRLPKRRFGSAYGGWTVLPERIRPDSVVYSAGVGDDISFDIELISNLGVTVQAFDPTPRAMAWVKARHLPAAFVFHALGLSDHDGESVFFAPIQPHHVSYSATNDANAGRTGIRLSVRRLSTIMNLLGHSRVDLLKMDIEGFEYAVIDDIVKTKCYPAQLLVEFHLPNRGQCAQMRRAVRTLRASGYQLFSVSSSGAELSFVRNEHAWAS
jgi:FkbM family methyltransferase